VAKKNDIRRIRTIIQAFFFILISVIAIRHLHFGGGPKGTPSIESYCPFGALASLYSYLTGGQFVKHIQLSSLVILIAVIVVTLLTRKSFCGWICPFGTLQEWIGKLGQKIFKNRYNPKGKVDSALRYVKYVLLVVIIFYSWKLGTLVFRDYDPYLAFFHFGTNIDEMTAAYIILGIVLVASLYIDRFWCKYACPLGAILGIVSKLGIITLKREDISRKKCEVCDAQCPMHIPVSTEYRITSAECIGCLECVQICPYHKKGILGLKLGKRPISANAFAGIIVLSFFFVIGAAKLSSYWESKPSKIVVVDASGAYDPDAMRGWMSLRDVSEAYKIPPGDLYKMANLPDSVSAEIPLKEISSHYKLRFSPEEFRDVLKKYLNERGKLAKQPVPGSRRGNASGIKGYMTLSEIVQKTGHSKEEILRKLNLPDSVSMTTPIRDLARKYRFEMRNAREKLEKWKD